MRRPRGLASRQRELTLLDLVDRLLGAGVVVGGDITLTVADVDLIYLQLRVLLSSVDSAEKMGITMPGPPRRRKPNEEPTDAARRVHRSYAERRPRPEPPPA